MCGILGVVRSAPMATFDVERMLHTLDARGPDGRGLRALDDGRVVFGHTRLAIIDLTDAGRQPMSNEDGSVWLTFNGEIYNYRELRRTLEQLGHRFASASDSEVIIHAYEQWGQDCVDQLCGIFAFGIWDARDRSLLLARDHFGVKPLYYLQHGEDFSFASQPKAIIEAPDVTPRMNHAALRDFFAYGYVPAERCIFEGMAKLPAGHVATFKQGALRVRRYFTLEHRPDHRGMRDATELADELLREAVSMQMVSDVPVGSFLSGGIDSSLLTALAMGRGGEPLRTFTIGFDEEDYDERRFARRVATAEGTVHHERVLSRADRFAGLANVVEAFDEPFNPNGPLPAYAVSRLAADEHTKVVLGGDGADEVFVGYLRYDQMARRTAFGGRAGRILRRLLPAARASSRRADWSDIVDYFRHEGTMRWPTQQRLFSSAAQRDLDDDILWPLRRHFRPELPAVTAVQYIDIHTYLPDHILFKVDRATMACGVEARVPFLDHRLVQAVFNLPLRTLYRNGERKALLKRVAARHLPADVVTARKKGFSSPLSHWADAEFKQWAHGLLAGGYLVGSGVVTAHWQEIFAGRQTESPGRALWLLIAAELWARRWLLGESAASMFPTELQGGGGRP